MQSDRKLVGFWLSKLSLAALRYLLRDCSWGWLPSRWFIILQVIHSNQYLVLPVHWFGDHEFATFPCVNNKWSYTKSMDRMFWCCFPIVENRYAHLLPKDEEVFEDYNTYSAKRFEEVRFKLLSSFKKFVDACV